MDTDTTIEPILDPKFMPAALWTRAYRSMCATSAAAHEVAIALERPDGTTYVRRTQLLPHEGESIALNRKHLERLVKSMLWLQGGSRLSIGGDAAMAAYIGQVYSPDGARSFDHRVVGEQMFLDGMTVEACPLESVPKPQDASVELGRHLDGCRIGFDLGGSDRKVAAVVDGKVVFSEEIEWNPYFEEDPNYHYDGIQDSLKRAAAHLPRVDAIGGSAAGVYVNNDVRVASLFRGVSSKDFDKHVRKIFHRIQADWNGVPFVVVNDGEVTALAGAMSLNDNAVLGVAMGTSQAVGYCNADGRITSWLNELAFAPIDYRDDSPADEWSGDIGCGVQYFSQQGVARLVPAAGIELPKDMPFAEQLVAVQELMAADDPRARRIYRTIGTYFGYALASYAEFYEIRHLLLLGRVTSGPGGGVIIEEAESVLAAAFPELRERIRISTPDEKMKRHGQAIAAASLPAIERMQ
jgi:predicted NBD/HSP70 family sugar kinase